MDRGDSFPADARVIRLLLRHGPPAHLHRGGPSRESGVPEPDPVAIRAGPCSLDRLRDSRSAVHHRRVHLVGLHARARRDLHGRHGSQAWRQTVADASPAHLRGGRGRRRSLLVAGEGGHSTSRGLRRCRRRVAHVPPPMGDTGAHVGRCTPRTRPDGSGSRVGRLRLAASRGSKHSAPGRRSRHRPRQVKAWLQSARRPPERPHLGPSGIFRVL
jgi:hypothetical protein